MHRKTSDPATSAADRLRFRKPALAGAILILAFAAAAADQTPARPKLGKFKLGADISATDAPGRGGGGGGGRAAGGGGAASGAGAVAGGGAAVGAQGTAGGGAARGGGGGRGPLNYNENGKPAEEWEILMRHGWNLFRLRIFVSPVRSAPDNSLENTIPLAKKIKAAGATFLLDLHFSDTWADPQHQDIPVAWRSLDIDGLEKAWEKHAYDTIKALKDSGAMPDMVQIGNEITRGAAWPLAQLQIPGNNQYLPPQPYDEAKQWSNLTRLLKAGIRGVDSAAGKTKPRIVIHIDQGGHWDATEWFFDRLNAANVKYDVIGQSFYPPWGHGSLDDLWNNMNQCAKRYKRDFAVVETGYMAPRTGSANKFMVWPTTPEGRLQFLADLMNTVRKAPRGISIMYWAPERDVWNADGTPGPSVFMLDKLTTLTKRPESKAPIAVHR